MTSTPGRTDVLVFGASGRVGQALSLLLPGSGLSVRGVSRADVDFSRDDEVAACIEAASPRTVVYAAAIADPDRCELDPAASYAANVAGVARVAAATARLGCRVVYYSSDYVFGSPGRYFEDAPPSPLQVYGRHKVEAERLLLSGGDNVVIRLPLLFGERDFVAAAVNAIATGTPLAVDDRTRYPIPLSHVVQVTAGLIASGAEPGIYHGVGIDAVTKSEWAAYIAGLLGKPLPPAAEAVDAFVAARPVDIELVSRHPQMRTAPGTLWAATQERVAELTGIEATPPTGG